MQRFGTGPNWFRNGSTTWGKRHPVAIDASSGASLGVVNITFNVPADWDDFWLNLTDTANGYDIVVCGPDGRTLLTFDLSGFSYANRTCTVRVQGFVLADTARVEVLWLYWQSAQATSLAGPVSTPLPGPISGYVSLGAPIPSYTVRAGPGVPGATSPSAQIGKHPLDEIDVFWDVSDQLLQRSPQALYANTTGLEGIAWVDVSLQAGATSSVDAALTRLILASDRLYVSSRHTGGTDGAREVAYLTMRTQPGTPTSSGRLLFFAFELVIEDGA